MRSDRRPHSHPAIPVDERVKTGVGRTVEILAADDHRVDDYRSLNDQPFRREYEGDRVFITEGSIAVDQLLRSTHQVRSLLCASSRRGRLAGTIAELERRGITTFVAGAGVLNEIVGFDLHRGIVAAAERPQPAAIDTLARAGKRLVLVEGINDPENLGAIARAARALHVDGMILDPTSIDPYSRRNVRVSMGHILHLPIARARPDDWQSIATTLAAHGFESWAMTPDPAADDVFSLPPPTRLAVALGAEGPGLSDALIASCNRRVRIPIDPTVDSLNVGHAAAITFAVVARTAPRP